MPASPAELLHAWHDFYILIGTASATLVGLMFVAASISSSLFNEEHNAALATFLTPTVIHFAAALFTALLATIPTESWWSLGGLIAAGGLAGTIHGAKLMFDFLVRRRFRVELIDHLYYALIPMIGYLVAIAAGVLLILRWEASANLIAAALLLLLFAGIRNAWDMMIWIVIKTPSGRPPLA